MPAARASVECCHTRDSDYAMRAHAALAPSRAEIAADAALLRRHMLTLFYRQRLPQHAVACRLTSLVHAMP